MRPFRYTGGFSSEKPPSLCRETSRLAEEPSFQAWMQEVERTMEALYGFHPDDLPDCPYADWHQAGMEAEEAARQALQEAIGDDFDG